MSLKVFPSSEILESILILSLSLSPTLLGVSLTLEAKPCFLLETRVKGLLHVTQQGGSGPRARS